MILAPAPFPIIRILRSVILGSSVFSDTAIQTIGSPATRTSRKDMRKKRKRSENGRRHSSSTGTTAPIRSACGRLALCNPGRRSQNQQDDALRWPLAYGGVRSGCQDAFLQANEAFAPKTLNESNHGDTATRPLAGRHSARGRLYHACSTSMIHPSVSVSLLAIHFTCVLLLPLDLSSR